MRYCIAILSFILCSISLRAQAPALPDPQPFAAQITPDDLRQVLTTLASAEMGGRETGEEGQRKAAAFIEAEFKALGLPAKGDNGSYQQKVTLQSESWSDLSVQVGKENYRNRIDFYVYPSYNADRPNPIKVREVVFAGYGAASNYGKANVQGKTVLIYRQAGQNSNPATDWQDEVQLAKQKGADLVFIVDADADNNIRNNRRLLTTYGWRPISTTVDANMYANTVFISPKIATALIGASMPKVEKALEALKSGSKFKPFRCKTDAEVRLDKDLKRLEGSNVIAFIEGSDPVLKNEYVFVTAHYDHLGRVDDLIYYGADDNGSGSSGVIEIARALADAKKQGVGPKRSVVCMLVSGEEKGLLGSRYYVDFPIFPLEKTVVDINIDMIGRVDPAHENNPNYVYVIGSNRLSSELHDIGERVNATYTKMELDYKYNDPNDPNRFYERSDHYNFAERGIPAIFFFNGTHADYHRTTDQVSKINFEALAKRAQLAFHVAWEVANRPGRLVVDKK